MRGPLSWGEQKLRLHPIPSHRVFVPDTLSTGENLSANSWPERPSLLIDLLNPARNAEAVFM